MADLPDLEDLTVADRRILVRSDLNVPMKNGVIGDDMRIRVAIPTIRRLLERGGKVAVCSHLGRPKGKVVDELRMAPVAARLGELLGEEVAVCDDVVGESARMACAWSERVVMLENLRFDPREEANDPEFAAALAGLAEAYVNDAFGAAHRAHASVVGVAERLPSAAGLLLADEVRKLEVLLDAPERPFVAVLGGAKVSDKLGVIANLIERVDALCIGGAMAFTLLAAQGHEVGRSLVERDRVEEVLGTLEQARSKGVEILVPSDVVATDTPEEGAAHGVASLGSIGDRMGVDIGPETAARFADRISSAKTVLWNGPMGIFEIEPYAGGTKTVAEAIAAATKAGAYTVAGGGDSAAALARFDLTGAVSHLSSGGGASLEFLEGKGLPGIEVLRRKKAEEEDK